MVAVRVADAAVLSLTLLGDIAYGAGVVALCVPPAAELGSQLVSAGQKVLKARDALSQKACEGLGAAAGTAVSRGGQRCGGGGGQW